MKTGKQLTFYVVRFFLLYSTKSNKLSFAVLVLFRNRFLVFQMNSIKLSLNLFQGNERFNFKEFFCDMIPLITF